MSIPPGQETHVYVGSWPDCGCTVAGHVDGADKSTAKWVADFIRSGLRVERVPVEDARNRLHHCPHRKKPGQRRRDDQLALEMPTP